jgi:polysaccharide biosynthesis protein PslG
MHTLRARLTALILAVLTVGTLLVGASAALAAPRPQAVAHNRPHARHHSRHHARRHVRRHHRPTLHFTWPVTAPTAPVITPTPPPPTTTTTPPPTTTTTPPTTTTTPPTTTTTPPTTTTTPVTGPTTPPVANSFGTAEAGIAAGGSLQNENPTMLGQDLDLDQSSGAKWLRIDINWAQIQNGGPNSYDWSHIDSVIQGAEARGMSVLGVILYTPAWARPAGTSASYGPAPAQYSQFAATAVAHYSALGVHAYEVWNEENNDQFWTPAPNTANYTAMLRAAYPAIKQADPTATVVTGGLSPEPNDGTNIAPVTFLQGIYANGGANHFDAVGAHPYCNPDLPGAPDAWSAWYQMYGTSTSLRSVMVANGDSAKKIWGTEFGTPSSGTSGVSPAFQAQTVTRAYQLWSSYSWAGPLFFYQGRDDGSDSSDLYDNYGFANTSFGLKPSFYAFQQSVSAL